MKNGTKSPAFLTTVTIVVAGVLALMAKTESISGALFFLPFSLGPLLISLILSIISAHRTCQIILICGSALYALWFIFVYMSAFYWHIDAQSAIALLFIGIYSLPVMVPVWISTLVIRHKYQTTVNKAVNKTAEQDNALNSSK